MIKLYVIKDSASQTTNDPFPMLTHRDAIQGLRDVVNDPKTTIHKHPEDFELHCLGEYNPREMSFDIYNTPERVSRAIELLEN